jgi:hypothetical protein
MSRSFSGSWIAFDCEQRGARRGMVSLMAAFSRVPSSSGEPGVVLFKCWLRWVTKTRVGLTNQAMADLTFCNMELIGPPRFDQELNSTGKAIKDSTSTEKTGKQVIRRARQARR